jgi:hypothetical protein
MLIAAVSGLSASAQPAADEGDQLEVITNCLYREARNLFPDANALERSVIWNADRTEAEVALKDGTTAIVTYRTINTNEGVKVSAKNHVEQADASFKERQSDMVGDCMFEAGIEEIMMN